MKFLTWYVRGLREPIKRSAAFAFLKKQKADIMTLVETHVEGRLQMALKRPWVGWAFHSTHTSHSRGVSILIAKSVQFELEEIKSDAQGRYIFISSKLFGESFLLMAFYIPPPFSITILLEGLTFMARYPTVPAIWMGDFNTTMNESIDRLRPQSVGTRGGKDTRLSKLTSSIHLFDTWRHKFPHTPAYSCFSSTHNSMSRIDYIFISQQLLPKLLQVSFGPRLLSDHSPYTMTISVPPKRPMRTLRLNPFWLTLSPEDESLATEWTHFFQNNVDSASMLAVWDAFKLHVRMTLTSHINKIKNDSMVAIEKAVKELHISEQTYMTDPSVTNANTLKLQMRLVSQMQYGKAKQKIVFHKTRLVRAWGKGW